MSLHLSVQTVQRQCFTATATAALLVSQSNVNNVGCIAGCCTRCWLQMRLSLLLLNCRCCLLACDAAESLLLAEVVCKMSPASNTHQYLTGSHQGQCVVAGLLQTLHSPASLDIHFAPGPLPASRSLLLNTLLNCCHQWCRAYSEGVVKFVPAWKQGQVAGSSSRVQQQSYNSCVLQWVPCVQHAVEPAGGIHTCLCKTNIRQQWMLHAACWSPPGLSGLAGGAGRAPLRPQRSSHC